MHPEVLGRKYDKIAVSWQNQHDQGQYGVRQLRRALKLHDTIPDGGRALDVGCGAGGRFVRLLDDQGYRVTRVDISEQMINLAAAAHPRHAFIRQNICTWETTESFDLILAWDSLFHLPLNQQEPVISKLCSWLNNGGTLVYTFGNATGEHEDQWHDDTFYYSSIGIDGNLRLLLDNGLAIQHLELDQHPERHVYVIATKERSLISAD